MILDNLNRWTQYSAISPRFARAFAFLEQAHEGLPLGRHEIAGDEVFAFVQQHQTKAVAGRLFEAHRKYIDIQFVLRGRELILWAPLSLLTDVTMPFDADQDAALFNGVPEAVPVQVIAGQFAILFPEDGHAPSCAWGEVAEVLKIVVKVLV